jgi:glucuronosyltransferase
MQFYPQIEKLLREDLGIKDMPSLRELEANVSLVLANTHYSDDYVRSYPPLVVPVGGMQCFQELKPASKEMETFMNGTGAKGFIYVSFGSAVQVKDMPSQLRKIFFTAMQNAKTNFFLKWSGDIPSDLPKNIFAASWVPQQTILAHPNCKGFITHGGLLGIQEAMFSGVPMIVAPVFGEQDYNAQKVHNQRRGIKIELRTLTQHDLDEAISKILTDPSYKKNMEEASKLFKDRQENPVDTAVWWTHFILRNGPVEALRPLGIKQSWFQRRLLDVWFTIFASLVLLPLLGIIVLCKICSKSGPKKEPENSHKKRN